ncbi:MAG TPA: phage baseplate assembly protein V [Allosphingosinicella sp.]
MTKPTDLSRHAGKYYGKYSGVVTDNSDPELRGRVRVQVPAIFGATATVFARPCFPYGHFFVPDVGTPVWVEFEGGHPDYPIWVGIWWAKDKTPAEAQVDPPTHRVIQTPSGHTIELSDEAGKEKVVIRNGKDAFVALQPDGSVVVSNKNGSNLFLNADGKEATLMSEQGHILTMTKDALVLVNDGGTVIELKGTTATILAKEISLGGTSVALGSGATDPTIMGNAFSLVWNLLAAHVHPTAMGPSGPATPPIMPLQPGVHLTSAVVVK